MNRDIYINRYASRYDRDFGLVHEAMVLILQVVHAVDGQSLEEHFSELSEKIDAELRSDVPDLQKCRLWIAGWHAFMRAANTPC